MRIFSRMAERAAAGQRNGTYLCRFLTELGAFQEAASMGRIVIADFTYENQSQGVCFAFLLTQKF